MRGDRKRERSHSGLKPELICTVVVVVVERMKGSLVLLESFIFSLGASFKFNFSLSAHRTWHRISSELRFSFPRINGPLTGPTCNWNGFVTASESAAQKRCVYIRIIGFVDRILSPSLLPMNHPA